MWEALAASGPQAGWLLFGVTGLLVIGSVVAGRLIPRSTHLREMGYLEREARAHQATITEQKEQIKTLLGSRDNKVGPVS